MKSLVWSRLTLVVLAAAFTVGNYASAATNFRVLYNFKNDPDGANPSAGFTADKAGSLYTTTFAGGNDPLVGCGTVVQLTPTQTGLTERVIWTFQRNNPNDGCNPQGGYLNIDSNGNIYGATSGGGTQDNGTLFELSKSGNAWTEKILYNFTGGNDGGSPNSGLVADAQGNLYGSTYTGGVYLAGTVFEVSPSGGHYTFKTIYQYVSGNSGSFEITGPLTIDAAGNLYGTAGPNLPVDYGSVFELSNVGGTWKFQTLYSFCSVDGCVDGWSPWGGVTLNRGKLYGVNTTGGTSGDGNIYELSLNGSTWQETVVDQFNGANGNFPFAPVTFDAAGNLYASALLGGANGDGSILKLTYENGNWQETIVHSFDGSDGSEPQSQLFIDNGYLIGAASGAGPQGNGNIFAIAQ